MTLPLEDCSPVQRDLAAGLGALTFINAKCHRPAVCFSSEKPHVRRSSLLPRTRETRQQLRWAGSVPTLPKNMPPKTCPFALYHYSGPCRTSYSRQFANNPIANNCWIISIPLKLFFLNCNYRIGKIICEKDLFLSCKGKYAKLQGPCNSK